MTRDQVERRLPSHGFFPPWYTIESRPFLFYYVRFQINKVFCCLLATQEVQKAVEQSEIFPELPDTDRAEVDKEIDQKVIGPAIYHSSVCPCPAFSFFVRAPVVWMTSVILWVNNAANQAVQGLEGGSGAGQPIRGGQETGKWQLRCGLSLHRPQEQQRTVSCNICVCLCVCVHCVCVCVCSFLCIMHNYIFV